MARESVEHTVNKSVTYARVGRTLLWGLLMSITVMILGSLLATIRGGDTSTVVPLSKELTELMRGNSAALLDLGILLMFATPVFGVVVALIQFVKERDRAFVGVSGALLLLLVAACGIALR